MHSDRIPVDSLEDVTEVARVAIPVDSLDDLTEVGHGAIPADSLDDVTEVATATPPNEPPATFAGGLPVDSLADVTEVVSGAVPVDSFDDVTEVVGGALPVDSLDDVTEVVGGALPVDSFDDVTEVVGGALPVDQTASVLPHDLLDEQTDVTHKVIDLREPVVSRQAVIGSRPERQSQSGSDGTMAPQSPASTQAEPTWQPPDRPRLPEAERATQRAAVVFKPVFAFVAALLLVICILVGYIVLSGDEPVGPQESIAEVQGDS